MRTQSWEGRGEYARTPGFSLMHSADPHGRQGGEPEPRRQPEARHPADLEAARGCEPRGACLERRERWDARLPGMDRPHDLGPRKVAAGAREGGSRLGEVCGGG